MMQWENSKMQTVRTITLVQPVYFYELLVTEYCSGKWCDHIPAYCQGHMKIVGLFQTLEQAEIAETNYPGNDIVTFRTIMIKLDKNYRNTLNFL